MMGKRSSSDRFELGLLADRSVDHAVELGELLALAEAGAPWPDVRLDDATLFFESGGRDWMPLHWVLGDLASLAQQFEAAFERLRSGEIAIVRSAVDDRPVVGYFLLEPRGDEAAVSLFYPPTHLRYVYPTAGARGAELYAFVANHRAELLIRPPEHRNPRDIIEAAIPLVVLLEALVREAKRARRVVALMTGE